MRRQEEEAVPAHPCRRVLACVTTRCACCAKVLGTGPVTPRVVGLSRARGCDRGERDHVGDDVAVLDYVEHSVEEVAYTDYFFSLSQKDTLLEPVTGSQIGKADCAILEAHRELPSRESTRAV